MDRSTARIAFTALTITTIVVLGGCMNASLSQSGNAPARINLQQVPDSVTEIRLTVSGPGMTTVEKTLTPDTDAVVLDLPVGPERVFEAVAGEYSGRTVVGVESEGIQVELRLSLSDVSDVSDVILFTATWDGDSEIYQVTVGGGEPTPLTENAVQDTGAFYTPDGSQILFESERDSTVGELYAMNADGSNVRRLTNNGVRENYRTVSPDSSTLAYSASDGNDTEIYTVPLSGGAATPLTDNNYDDADVFSFMAWSPDGNRILYGADSDGDTYDELWVMDADGSNARFLADSAFGDYISSSSGAFWLGSGSDRIGYLRENSLGSALLSIAPDPLALDEQTLVSVGNDFSLSRVRAAPTGDRIAYSSDKDGTEDLYSVSVSGGSSVRLTNSAQSESTPVWSPDGERIASTFGPVLYSEVGFARADGSGSFQAITSDSFDDSVADWSPDGDSLAYVKNFGSSDFAAPVIFVADVSSGVGSVVQLFEQQGSGYNVYGVQWRPSR